ncbi:MAG: LL-diaminopimelate aminotransferase [Sphaerochaetaceae bacterium]|nr:LL-diaminopimelate aminotransferase [Sphaerochaetaceae bacterium]
MAHANPNFLRLAGGYLFPEITRRARLWQERHPDAKVLRLGIGNTTEALSPVVADAMKRKVDLLRDRRTYTGYGDEQGDNALREGLAAYYRRQWGVFLDPSEFFVSDGAKSDAANLQELFGPDDIVAVQDPAYPVYVDSNVVGGRSGEWAGTSYRRFVYLESTAGNGFIPVPPDGHVDVVYLCFPNNPTGAMATKGQLRAFVDYCIREKAVLVYDASYCEYITEIGYPHSIYEVEGATGCAIEINSFSKFAGFTGVRLGWTIVPKAIDIGGPGLLNKLWNRRQCTFFNGASNISQAGGLAALSGEGWRQCRELVGYYLENARVIRKGLASIGLTCHGGVNSPYVWVRAPLDMTSWDFFDLLLEKAHVVVTPGSGFGPAGEHYVRVSAYGHREDVVEAVGSIERNIRI